MLLGGIRTGSATRFVFVSARATRQPAALEFARHGDPHVIGVRLAIKVLDDAAALFARHVYRGLVSGATVRQAFEMGQAAVAANAPSLSLPAPVEEARKFILLPEWKEGDDGPDPHDKILFPTLPGGPLQERSPLPQHEPPNIQQPFLGRAVELQRLVLMLGRRRQKPVGSISLAGRRASALPLATAAAAHLYERRWFTEGAVVVDMRGRRTEDDALSALSAGLGHGARIACSTSRALQRWQGLLSSTIATRRSRETRRRRRRRQRLLPRLLGKPRPRQEVRVLCTSRVAIPSTRARTVEVKPLSPNDAARLFRELATLGGAPRRPPRGRRPALAPGARRARESAAGDLADGAAAAPRRPWPRSRSTSPTPPPQRVVPTRGSDAGDARSPSGSSPRRRSARPRRRHGRAAEGAAPAGERPDCDPHRHRRRRRHHHHGGAADRGEERVSADALIAEVASHAMAGRMPSASEAAVRAGRRPP